MNRTQLIKKLQVGKILSITLRPCCQRFSRKVLKIELTLSSTFRSPIYSENLTGRTRLSSSPNQWRAIDTETPETLNQYKKSSDLLPWTWGSFILPPTKCSRRTRVPPDGSESSWISSYTIDINRLYTIYYTLYIHTIDIIWTEDVFKDVKQKWKPCLPRFPFLFPYESYVHFSSHTLSSETSLPPLSLCLLNLTLLFFILTTYVTL